MATPGTNELKDKMNVAAASATKLVSAAIRDGLTKDAACLSVLIGVISAIRVERLNEEALLKEARRAVPPAPPPMPSHWKKT